MDPIAPIVSEGPLALSRLDPGGALAEAAERAGSLSRRSLVVSALAGGLGLLGVSGRAQAAGPRGRDTALMNFALTLEYLQAGFYSEAERRAALSTANARMATRIGAVERAHVDALRRLLGRDAVARPFFDFQGTTEDDAEFIKTAIGVEDLSTAVYQSAIGHLTQPALISGAASIHTVEARHATWLRLQSGFPATLQGLDDPISYSEARALLASSGLLREPPRVVAHTPPTFAG